MNIIRRILKWLGFGKTELPDQPLSDDYVSLSVNEETMDVEITDSRGVDSPADPPVYKKPKHRGRDGTMYGPFRSRQGG